MFELGALKLDVEWLKMGLSQRKLGSFGHAIIQQHRLSVRCQSVAGALSATSEPQGAGRRRAASKISLSSAPAANQMLPFLPPHVSRTDRCPLGLQGSGAGPKFAVGIRPIREGHTPP